MSAFKNPPPGSYVSEEGWLVVGEEAWTLREWNGDPEGAKYHNRYATDAERIAARRRARREHMRRVRAA